MKALSRLKLTIPNMTYMAAAALALVSLIILWLWMTSEPEGEWQERVPSQIDLHPPSVDEGISAILRGELIQSDGIPAEIPGSWPRFRGTNFDGISAEDVALAEAWAEGEPKVLWSVDVGEGYAGAAVRNGRVYLLDYDMEQKADALRCLSLADGKEIWRYSYPVKTKRNHGMSRTVPAVTDEHVVGLGPKCHVICLDSITGEFRWGIDLVRDFGTTVPLWYAGQCPLIDGGRVILAPGGEMLMIAVDIETGEVVWETPNPRRWKMTHASIMPMVFAGKRMYVYCASGGVVGISAEDGTLLWETSEWRISIATVPSALIMDEGRIFLSGGYNAGSMMLQLREDNGTIIAEPVFRLEAEVFGATQHTPILFEDHIYGVRPDGQLVCLDTNGKVLWASGAAHSFGLGPFLIANGLIYVMDDSGLLTLTKAGSSNYTQLAQAQVLTGHDSWGPMAIVGGRLIARDLTQMVCLDVRAK